jgi:hypothetical protein
VTGRIPASEAMAAAPGPHHTGGREDEVAHPSAGFHGLGRRDAAGHAEAVLRRARGVLGVPG